MRGVSLGNQGALGKGQQLPGSPCFSRWCGHAPGRVRSGARRCDRASGSSRASPGRCPCRCCTSDPSPAPAQHNHFPSAIPHAAHCTTARCMDCLPEYDLRDSITIVACCTLRSSKACNLLAAHSRLLLKCEVEDGVCLFRDIP